MRGLSICAFVPLLAVALAMPHHGDHMGHTEKQYHHLHHAPGAEHNHDGEDTCLKLSPPNADFAFALYKNLRAKAAAGENIFYSPLGIATALAMLATGARDETHSQMFSTLGYNPGHLRPMSQAQVNEAYEHLLHMLGHQSQTQQLDIGNAVALRQGLKTPEKFLADIKHFYAGEAMTVDFANEAGALAQINGFIAKKTQDKITDLLTSLDADTAMVLINYVFFRGKWEKPFEASQTYKEDFKVDDTLTVKVDMMKRTGRYDFYQDSVNHTSVILLPYKSNTSMMIVLPDEGKMQEVEANINKDYIKHWHDSLFRSSVDLFLPKFSIAASASLETTLKELGITDAFQDTADFSGISVEPRVKVSKVSHKAVLSVDETGTEAAAATTIEIMPMSMPDTMKLDRPFLVFILEHSTRSILFMGKISNPAA